MAAFSGLENVTFSLGAFSLEDPAALDALQYHHTSAEAKSGNGTHQVDADSIYNIASITKVFTAYAGLLNLNHEQWETPLQDCIPGLSEFLQNNSDSQDAVTRTQWADITLWDLVNQQGGVAEQPPQSDYYISYLLGLLPSWSDLGFPEPTELLNETPCLQGDGSCDAIQYAESVGWYHPNVLPWSTPLYANNGFILLGMAITNLTGRPIADVLQDSVFKKLALTSTSAGAPTSAADIARSAFVRDSVFFAVTPVFIPSGGIYSSLRDLAAFGTGILNSTLLTPKQTRKWLKPSSHTANFNYSVGAPWEIVRYTSPETGKVTDLYTKAGHSGDTDSHFVIIPDYNAGFTYLSVASNATLRASLTGPILDVVVAAVLPALEQQAAAEAIANFAGSYTSEDPNLSSSVTITFNETTVKNVGAALSVSQWISSGTDMLASVIDGRPRLVLSIPDQGDGRVAFYALPSSSVPSGLFTGTQATNGDWILLDAQRYGGFGMVFVFDVDGEGRATAITPLPTRATLQRAVER